MIKQLYFESGLTSDKGKIQIPASQEPKIYNASLEKNSTGKLIVEKLRRKKKNDFQAIVQQCHGASTVKQLLGHRLNEHFLLLPLIF